MRCTGEGCERKNECARYYLKAPADGEIHTLESLYSFGSGSIRSDGTVEETYWCSPLGNWGMFVPIEKTNGDRIRSMSDEELAELIAKEILNITGAGRLSLAIPAWTRWLKEPAKEVEYGESD